MRICIVYICAYIVLVCIGIYIHAYVHFLCGCNSEARRAFDLCNLCSMFFEQTFIHAFCRTFAAALPFCPFSTFAVSLPGTFCRTFAQTVPRFISNGFKPF